MISVLYMEGDARKLISHFLQRTLLFLVWYLMTCSIFSDSGGTSSYSVKERVSEPILSRTDRITTTGHRQSGIS